MEIPIELLGAVKFLIIAFVVAVIYGGLGKL